MPLLCKFIFAIIGNTIDVMDFSDPANIIESISVAKMNWFRKHLSCALIPKGQNDNPTVAICKFLTNFDFKNHNFTMYVY